ncbi:A disintegrin and metalloproteinase with thrombospondin motifs 12-like isoform X2 [Artemia franciscana]|nr:hypothetical protein QYM36_016604 [Artemia franciscana]
MTLQSRFSKDNEEDECDGESMLYRFCEWQNEKNIYNDSHPQHHDAAVLITRCKLCTNATSSCATYGLAELGGICHPLRSCSIARDTGLYTAYTIAHEIGHNLGIPHDNGRTPCPEQLHTHIMARSLSPTFTMEEIWSNCSRSHVTNFLDRNELQCLNDESEFAYPLDDILPGIKYDADHQCQLFFGGDAKSCANTPEEMATMCGMLWCRNGGICMSKGERAADGTECGKYMWCIHGKCVLIEEPASPVDGGWGDWSTWSDCSRTCGGGVSYMERHCDNPKPDHGGRFCIGDRRKYRLCNTEACANATASFRAEQCRAFNSIPYENNFYRWEPVYIQGSPCQLHCKPENTSFIVSLAEVVIDGTPCQPGKKNVCINGICKAVGCDWVINSDTSEDICGVCSGTGKTCKRIQDYIQDTLNCSGSTIPITSIPVGAKNIRVVHTTENNEGLIVKGSSYVKLQAALSAGWSGEFIFGEHILYYLRSIGTGTAYIPGPIIDELQIMFICNEGSDSRVDWEYVLPLQNETEVFEDYRWEYGEWSSCSSACGEGIQVSLPVCFRAENQSIVDDHHCSVEEQPLPLRRICMLQNCPPRWWSGPWQPCSQTCGYDAYRRRTVLCVVKVDGVDVPLDDTRACKAKRPKEEEPCFLTNCVD